MMIDFLADFVLGCCFIVAGKWFVEVNDQLFHAAVMSGVALFLMIGWGVYLIARGLCQYVETELS